MNASVSMASATPALLGRFAERAAERPGAPAAGGGRQTISYRDLDRQSNQLARHLQTLGIRPEVPVGIYVERSTAFVVAALAALKSGGAYLPLDPAYPPERIHEILEDAGAPVLVTHRWMASGLPGGAWRTTDLDVDARQIAGYSEEPVECGADGASLAYLIYTSGSTGRPKGVEITHDNLANLVAWHNRAFRVTADDRASQVAGLGFDAAVWEIWPYLAAGASLHLIDEITRRSPEALRDWLVERGITIGFVPTIMAEHLIALEWPADTALRTLLTGADTLRRYPPAGLPFTLVNNYGPTECTVVATSGAVCPETDLNALPPIGRPVDNTGIYILDGALRAAAPGEEGELYIGGAGVGRGYRNLPDVTAAKFLNNPFARGKLFRTGDRARLLPNGEIAFLGRMDEQVKVRGFRVEPNEIAAALNRHPGVLNSVVAPWRDAAGEQNLAAYLVPAQDAKLTRAALREFLAKRLPDYMIPAAFVPVEALPLTANGKCDLAALPQPGPDNRLDNETRANTASNAVEDRIASIVTALIGLSSVGRDDNFFFIGGHSLLAAQLLARVREGFGVQLTLRQMFEAPTVAALAAEVSRLLGTAGNGN